MPSLTISWGVRPTIFCPSRKTVPAVGFCTPVMMLNKVLFPAPLAPISPTISPCSIANETSLKATRPPKSMVTPRTSSRAKASPPLPKPWTFIASSPSSDIFSRRDLLKELGVLVVSVQVVLKRRVGGMDGHSPSAGLAEVVHLRVDNLRQNLLGQSW